MAELSPAEEDIKNYVSDSLNSYIHGGKHYTLPWIKDIIRKSGIAAGTLKIVFDELRPEKYDGSGRYQTIYEICSNANFSSTNI
jgi:hypothetical protein